MEKYKTKIHKKILFISFLLISMIGIYYPSKKENTKLFDYCYDLEKILSRNSIQKRKNISEKLKSLSRDLSKFGVNKTRGSLINKIINQYKTSKNSFIIKIIPNKIYCLSGYWVERVIPGTFEAVIYDKSQKKITEFRELKEEVDGIINNFNSEYQKIKDDFNSIF
tara:strand:- start:366 stop:863 length:498 start_codon:yes stop_codon:yes gene_type:complete